MRAAPDGYTLLSGNNGSMVVQSVVKKPAPYDAATAFTPVAKVADAPNYIAISGALQSSMGTQTRRSKARLTREQPYLSLRLPRAKEPDRIRKLGRRPPSNPLMLFSCVHCGPRPINPVGIDRPASCLTKRLPAMRSSRRT